MTRIKPTVELIEGVLARIPEGFIHKSRLGKRFRPIDLETQNGKIARCGDYLYDAARLTSEQVQAQSQWCRPVLPAINLDGTLPGLAIMERQRQRQQVLLQHASSDSLIRILDVIAAGPGYAVASDLDGSADAESALQRLLKLGILRPFEGFIFDPLRLSHETMREVSRRHRLVPIYEQIREFLLSRPGQTAPQQELIEKFGKETLNEVLSLGEFVTFSVTSKKESGKSIWARLKESDPRETQKIAAKAEIIKDSDWQPSLELCGDILRPGAQDGKKRRTRVIARSYTVTAAAKRLGISQPAIERAIRDGLIPSFVDPEGRSRVPAHAVEAACADSAYSEQLTSCEILKVRDLAIVTGVSYSAMRSRLHQAEISRTRPRWGQVRGRWELPDTLREFREILKTKMAELRAVRAAERAEKQRQLAELRERERIEQELERQRREILRARLVAAFPTWQHEGRIDQHIILHVGPPNSGKTHHALNRLVEAGSGWYLAPLRLLAFEVFDRLNQQGVYCSLLTGEEYIPVPGATITAATIEMFSPQHSGQCVIIDEVQMLADPDRGWAWTRALMEAQAPDIHVVGPPTARLLIEQLAGAAALPLNILEYERLAPIRVADRHWPLEQLPPRTILVAFSRQSVLQLKTELERRKRRVSVIYGNLPPEVRRKQADRFASGETDICVATDAVGMGLNLPADYVCFYETQKYDGEQTRNLTSGEVHQIGGRAGRFGLSTAGEIGATTRQDLRLIRELYHSPPGLLTHARVAPSVEDLEMIPGSLAAKLEQWASLQSIPDSLRGAIKTADLAERVELASMLTDEEVGQLGLATALKLVNAPTRLNTRPYWRACASAILARQPMPLPPPPPEEINNSIDLENIELCISCADNYLWLAHRPEFTVYAPYTAEVRADRAEWSSRIDTALLRRLDTVRRCARCGAPLPFGHRFSICDNCYRSNRRDYADYR